MDTELVGLALFVLTFIVLALAAARFGADSRSTRSERPNW